MRLKKIILCGFKSFADKTEFEFGNGVTVVVGPNGCGKSNIVDAVKWVLGEQSAKSLRGGQMMDVIFNGANTRKSMGVAEVALVFENTQGMLNSDTDEVIVTRKLYRSGESEYLLNKKTCRLRDVREMFMDTGIGADAYSIIEQGKVEVLLQASKQDRRAIFEEAAGISRYKVRKKEALRKLDRTEQNMLRLTDVIAELEKRLRSIRYQAGKARNYQTYSTRLKQLRLKQFMADYHKLQNQTANEKEHLAGIQDELIGVTSATEKAQAKLSLLDHEMDQVEQEVRNNENHLLEYTSEIRTQQDRIESGHRRCDELSEAIGTSRQRLSTLEQQVHQFDKQIQDIQEELDQTQKALESQQSEIQSLQESRQQRALEINEYRAQREDEKSGLLDIVRRTAQLHNEINTFDFKQNDLSGQRERLSSRSGKISTELEGYLTERLRWQGQLENIEKLLSDSQEQLDSNREQLSQVSHNHLACTENLAAAKEYRSGLISRKQVLSDLEAQLEGVDQGVKHILKAKSENSDNFYYAKAMVAELLRADVEYAAIIEAALGDRSQYLVATSSQAVLEDSENLQELPGRVHMICLDRLPAYSNGYDFSVHPEVQAKAVELVAVAPENERLAWHLLGKTIVVDTIDSAMRLAQVAPPGYRWVTLAGEILEPDGTVHLGPQVTQSGLISRKSELRQLDTSLSEADDRITELQNQHQQFANQADHLEKNLQNLRTAIYETNTEKVHATHQIEQLTHDINRLKEEQPLIASEIAGIEDQIQEAVRLQDVSRKDLVDLETVNNQRQDRINNLDEAIEQLEADDQIVMEKITDLKVSIGQTQQKRLDLQDRLASINSQQQQYRHNINTLQTDLSNAQESFNNSERRILTAESQISQLFLSRQQVQDSNVSLRSKRDEIHDEKEQLAAETARQLHKREELQEQLHNVQMKLNEHQLRIENLAQRAREDIGLDVDYQYRRIQAIRRGEPVPEPPQVVQMVQQEQESSAEGEYAEGKQAEGEHAEGESAEKTDEQVESQQAKQSAEQARVAQQAQAQQEAQAIQDQEDIELLEHPEQIDWDTVATEIEDLRRKIDRLGNINLDAISEQEELEERHEYLTNQAKDLQDSARQLQELISTINRESEERFRSNFETIRDNFMDLFRKLFGGGRADIVLEDPEDILECGIEIVARPPGKQLQSISLLSGGEKTMTAVALLMAIFKSKPSPFCLLDEVDAALDEANVERFNLVVQDFLSGSQFVIITHSRRTMSIADVIYGVTMQEQGVSKKVSVRFGQDEDTETDAAVA